MPTNDRWGAKFQLSGERAEGLGVDWRAIMRVLLIRDREGERCDVIKSQLLDRLAAAKPNLHSRDVERVVDAILDEITDALTRGARVELRGFCVQRGRPW